MEPNDQIPSDATTETQTPIDESPATQPDRTADDVALVRDFIVAADPGLIAELVTGATVGEVLASVAAARAAYRRVAEHVRAAGPGAEPADRPAPVPAVPAGGAPPFVVDPGDLPSGELIRRGISAARGVSG